ncbi:hypothetical protein ALC57_11226, partial [Trachymyrmex cornetzi]
EDWLSFKNIFLFLVASDPSLVKVGKLYYLKKCLKNKTEQMVNRLPTTNKNKYQLAWLILKNRHQNNRLFVRMPRDIHCAVKDEG